MPIKKIILFFSFYFCALCSHAQKDDITFLVKKIEFEYPGFADKSNKKSFRKMVRDVLDRNREDTFKAMSLIVDFFGDRHLQIYTPKAFVHVDSNECFNNTKYVASCLNSKAKKIQYEGYWVNDYHDCVIGLIKDSLKDAYCAYVVEERGSNLLKGQLMAKLQKTVKGYYLTDFCSPYSGSRYFVRTMFRNDSVMTTGADGKWTKIRDYDNDLLHTLPVYSYQTTAGQIDQRNFLITLPICTRENANKLDSLVKANYKTISATENLIIDIRNNLGGTSSAFAPLMQFAYTKPMVWPNRYLYCTETGVSNMENDLKSYINKGNADSQYIENYQYYIDLQKENIGKLVLYPADTFKGPAILKFPKHVAVITNYGCQSAAELLVLMFKQSKKVTTFGEHTMGAVDYLDYYANEMPSGKCKLLIATTKRHIEKGGKKYDGKGIKPDILINDSVQDWVDFTVRYYEKGKN